MKKVLAFIVLLLIFALFFSACNSIAIPGPQGEPGKTGPQGEKGDVGAQGDPGVGIQNLFVNENGELMILLTDGTEINAGIVRQENVEEDDNTKCYFMIHATGKEEYRIRSLFEHTTSQNMSIDWGDGQSTSNVLCKEDCQHTYSETGDYLISVAGITALSNLFLRSNPSILWAKISNQILSIGNDVLSECENLTELVFTGACPVIGKRFGYKSSLKKVTVPTNYALDFYASVPDELVPCLAVDTSCIYCPKTVTVGAAGDFATITAAMQYLSQFYPVYKSGGMTCEIRILSGTVITEQIYVKQMDLQFITITSEDAFVPVCCNGWATTMDAHDARGNYVFIAGEYAAKIPAIGCVFKLTENVNQEKIAGLVCNRGSECVVLPGCGFDSFYDGVISNNESSVTIREGIARNCTRYGVHARHNGEISARSAVLTGNGIATYADRVADLDIREAYLDNSVIAIRCEHASTICASGAHATNCGVAGGDPLIYSSYGSNIDCSQMAIDSPKAKVYVVACGGQIIDFATITNADGVEIYCQDVNKLTANGVIYAQTVKG